MYATKRKRKEVQNKMSAKTKERENNKIAMAYLGGTLDYFSPILYRAWDKWGQDLQLDMLIEEMAELTVKINHFKRNRIRKKTLSEEMADVLICFSQVIKALDLKRDINDKIYDKMHRLEERLKKEKGGTPR